MPDDEVWEDTVPLQYDINSSDIDVEFAVHVLVWFGELAEEDLYWSLEVWIFPFREAMSAHALLV